MNGQDGMKIIRLDSIATESVKWLWYPYIPRGKITLLQGDPGSGKTMLALMIASIVTTGGEFFGDINKRETASVIFQSAEDGLADTIKPRMELMSPDFSKVFVIDESETGLSLSDERIEEALKEIYPALLIIDPLQAYLGADVDMHRANQVRPVLSRVGRLAEQVLFVMHMSKMMQTKAIYRGLGSIDIPAAARSLLVVGCNPDDPDQKILAHEKSSLAPNGESIAFRIDDTAGVVFEGYSDLTADQITSNIKSHSKSKNQVEEAVELLREMLSGDGFAELSKITTAANKAGISNRTLHRAKDKLMLKKISHGFSSKKTWWLLPNTDESVVTENANDNTIY